MALCGVKLGVLVGRPCMQARSSRTHGTCRACHMVFPQCDGCRLMRSRGVAHFDHGAVEDVIAEDARRAAQYQTHRWLRHIGEMP